ncbi:hypothetical protein [Nitrosovibrio sp. Nv4]|uniref:hypothetical protein n=1 Tax=Nitrosovibrio sp. Nv4 TaxID=1945880 RepID=UPI000BD4EA98|nr:hypothetical protein [Nitrosovibrio sp. Nv4]SOD39836.1 hypothetical protein SAMN06298226_0067 [Nitrosovibrio sp. Nv4]
MTIRIKAADMNLAEVALQPDHLSPAVDMNDVDAICSLMESYESDQILDEEENEIDLMIQLSGMVYNETRSDE